MDMNNESDDVEVLKKRLASAEAELKKRHRITKSRSRRIGFMIVVFGIVLMIEGQNYIGLLTILIGVQFIF